MRLKGRNTILRMGLMQDLMKKLRELNYYSSTSFGETEYER